MRRPLPPLNALRAFEAFARHGSMTAAADELCVTHGAVSRQVKQLQDQLGVVLVEGPRNRLQLTPAGRILADGLTAPFDGISQAVSAARAGPGARREIEIACLGTFAMKWLIPRLSRFVEQHPDLRVRVSESFGPVDFRRQSCDGAIRIVDHDDPAFEPRAAFLANNHGPVVAADLAGADLTVADLFRLPRLYATTYREGWRTWTAANGLDLPPPTAEREFGHNHSLIEAAAAGLGAAVIPWSFVAPDIESGRLAAPFGFISRPASYVFLRPPHRADPAMDAFQDWLIAEGAATPAPPAPIRPA
ncbi:LysR family transcriptional regulator [Brevundimonas sp. BAL450]|uniref:Transcriptional regulator, LysR family n=1 Tax=Brevundimonas abyssalis TAR-001 TaxID=1391729 RepID=A0A8E0NCJ8_9CAUL|nr:MULTISPECIES: LysR substrate-binding domain-containing protein [Brevundimonas]MBG7615193.1 LysR family transcriptional regulator [Brevundimonas sp. BAL450]GAD59855.1 transcriptional regulator, LysR family [Brevundimonas abyssalis TAR-001]